MDQYSVSLKVDTARSVPADIVTIAHAEQNKNFILVQNG
jgi:hypothetical protein